MLNKLMNIIENPVKSLIVTFIGAVTGYIPTTIATITYTENTSAELLFQYAIWTSTILVAITAIITWIQKQRDRWVERHPKKNKNN